MSGFDEYVKTGLIKTEKKESAFDAWYKENEADIEEEYQEYVKDTEHLGDKPMMKKEWAKEIFESQTVEEAKGPKFKSQKEKDEYYSGVKESLKGELQRGSITQDQYDKKISVIEKEEKENIITNESVSPASFIDKILTEKKESVIKQYPELMEIAKKIAKDASIQMNELTKNVKSEMPYKAKYVLEKVIEILEAKV